jgi:hypothetical protein
MLIDLSLQVIQLLLLLFFQKVFIVLLDRIWELERYHRIGLPIRLLVDICNYSLIDELRAVNISIDPYERLVLVV